MTWTWTRPLPALALVLCAACGEPAASGDGDGSTNDVCVDMDLPNFQVGPCQPLGLPAEPNPDQLEAGADDNHCESHADCVEGLNGRCAWLDGFYYGCVYDDCLTSEACEAGQLCACGPSRHQCVPFDCVTDDDCEGDSTCRWNVPSCVGVAGRFCHTPGDTCCSNADCPDDELNQTIGACVWDAGALRWGCGIQSCYD